MSLDNGIVQLIADGGVGGEAVVKVHLRTRFPGLGGTIITNEGAVAAMRIENNPVPLSGHRMFIRHAVIKKLDDFFYRTGVYLFSHVPRPLGSLSRRAPEPREAYLYEWAFGSETFAWEENDSEGKTTQIQLIDWNEFESHFAAAGVNMRDDVTDADDSRMSNNIIHQYPCRTISGDRCPLWKRIDFSTKSAPIDLECLSAYLANNRTQLLEVLRSERYEMVCLAVRYLADSKGMTQYDIGRMEQLLGQYRLSSMSHYVFAFGPTSTPVRFAYPIRFGDTGESLLL